MKISKTALTIIIAIVINAFIAGVGWGIQTQKIASLEREAERFRIDTIASFNRLENRLELWYRNSQPIPRKETQNDYEE
jgi:hypothetical protein